MKKYSVFRVIIHHPFKTFFLTVIMATLLIYVSVGLEISTVDNVMLPCLIGGFILALYILKRHYNKKYANGSVPPRRKSLLFGMIKHMNNSVDSYGSAVGNAFMDSFKGSSSWEADEARYRARQQANAAARAKWNALDRQKKAEWDARDAALRGKDIAARQYQNQADYWCGQGRK